MKNLKADLSLAHGGDSRTSDDRASTADLDEDGRLIDIYDHFFDCAPAETMDLQELAYRLRFLVYCVEHPFEDPDENPGWMETDEYDLHSLHSLLVHRPTGLVAGAVRLILPHKNGVPVELPIRRLCKHRWMADDSQILPRAQTAEISRFAIAKAFRRRMADRLPVVGGGGSESNHRRLIPHISLGLMRSIVAMTAQSGMTHLCAVMEPALLRLLRRLGIHFNDLGKPVDYHGRRQPCFSDLDVLLARTWIERREVWEVLTSDGRIWPLNEALVAALRSAGVKAR